MEGNAMDRLEIALSVGTLVFLLTILAGMIAGVFEQNETRLSTIQSRGHRNGDEPTRIIQRS